MRKKERREQAPRPTVVLSPQSQNATAPLEKTRGAVKGYYNIYASSSLIILRVFRIEEADTENSSSPHASR